MRDILIVVDMQKDVPILVDAACCAGVTPDSHNTALASMKTCQVQVIND